MNILQILPRLETGGVERGTLEIATAIQHEGFNSFVASAGGKMVPSLEERGSVHISMPLASKNPFVIIWNGWKLSQVVKTYKINILHARSRAPAWSALIAARISGVKLVTTFHGRYGIENPLKCIYNSVMVRGDAVIAVSNFIANHIIQYYHLTSLKKLVTIPRGVDIDYFNSEKLTSERVKKAKSHLIHYGPQIKMILPGRLTRGKGHLYLLEILKNVTNENWTCYIVGGHTPDHEAYVDELRHCIKSFNLTKKVFILPDYNDMPSLYEVVDIVISTALIPEAFGRTIIEAQAMKKIAIATAHGGALETISHQHNGFHIPLNQPKLAAAVIDEALTITGDKKNHILQSGRRNAELHYSLSSMCHKTISVYKSLFIR